MGRVEGRGFNVSTRRDKFYDAIDWLRHRPQRIEQRLAQRYLDDAQVLYDISSSFYECRTCPLMQFGYSRDGKRGRPIAVPDQVETLRQYPGLGWISALCHDAIRKLADEHSVQMSLFDERNLAEIYSPLYSGERLVVSSNPVVQRLELPARNPHWHQRAGVRGAVFTSEACHDERW